jgi:hypothetical protein
VASFVLNGDEFVFCFTAMSVGRSQIVYWTTRRMVSDKFAAIFQEDMLIITNKMQRNAIFFIAVKALHVSGGFPAHHQEPKTRTYSTWNNSPTLAAVASKLEIYQMLHVQFLSS